MIKIAMLAASAVICVGLWKTARDISRSLGEKIRR